MAEILGISASRLRSLARSVLVDPKRGDQNEYRFSFADVIILRTTRDLMESGIPLRRVKRVLNSLREQLPHDQPLSALHITSDGDSVVDFSVQELAEKIAPIAGAIVERTPISEMTADDWYDLALDLEGVATDRAKEAYTRAIVLNPGHVHAHLNLGRLLHEAGEIESAEAHYRQALSANPESALAAFNLGVALEDLDRVGDAIEAYQRALRFEPDTASAHYNLSRLYEERGLSQEALRHLADYKRLV